MRGLSVQFGSQTVVDNVGFTLRAGRTLGVVGESGCGKSMTALAMLNLVPPPGLTSGSICLDGLDLLGQPAAVWRRLRGDRLAMVFQEPMSALNPVMTIGRQIAEVTVLHQGHTWRQAQANAVAALAAVGITAPSVRAHEYPHQLSGGMRQRAMLAMALACRPAVLIADEPTTALDVTIQAQILELMQALQEQIGMAIHFISHNLAVVSEIADEIVVMYAGRIVERAPAATIFARPAHPYTSGLIATLPDPDHRVARLPVIAGSVLDRAPVGCPFAPRCPRADSVCRAQNPELRRIDAEHDVACFNPARMTRPLVQLQDITVRFGKLRAVESVTFEIAEAEVLGLVGESGSGKSTIGNVIAGLQAPTAGHWHYHGPSPRRDIQLIFQDPFSALDPRMPLATLIAEPLRIHKIGRPAARRARVQTLLDQVGLEAAAMDRYAHEFSGGQRQRIAIARALAPEPALIIADEPLSALDVSIQSQVLNLFSSIRETRPVAMLFISHDLAVVNHLADRVAVLYLGRLMEIAPRAALFAAPAHPYTAALLDAVPRIGRRRPLGSAIRGEMPSPLNPPPGCVFHPRCPKQQPICRAVVPALAPLRPRHLAACHFPA